MPLNVMASAKRAVLLLATYSLLNANQGSAQPEPSKGAAAGCLIQTAFKLPDKSTYTTEHCVSGPDRCNSAPNGYCFDFGIIDPSIVSKSCTPVAQCPPPSGK